MKKNSDGARSGKGDVASSRSSPLAKTSSTGIESTLAAGPVFTDCQFDNLDFSGRLLVGATFTGCSLRRCSFQDCDLTHTKFTDCDLYCADFRGSILYVTRITHCDLTKAKFTGALLSGIRLSDVECTHTEFDDVFELGRGRKTTVDALDLSDEISAFGSYIHTAKEFEQKRNKIVVQGQPHIALYDDPPNEKWRLWRRRAEICKILKRTMQENGYFDRVTELYYKERVFSNRANTSGTRRLLDWLFGNLVWGYGVMWYRAVITFGVLTATFAGIYLLIPLVSHQSGVRLPSGQFVDIRSGDASLQILRSFYFSVQSSLLNNFGDMIPTGIAKIVVSIQMILSVVMAGLLISSFSKRNANI